MKRITVILFVLAAFLTGGCTEPVLPENSAFFSCTQEAVCSGRIDRDAYGFFDLAADTGIIVPGLRQNFVPQGIAYWEGKNWLMLSGYFMPLSRSFASAVLAVDLETGNLAGEYTLADAMGREYGGHFSGVAVTKTDLYVTGPYCLYRVPLMEIVRTGKQGVLQVAQKLPVSVAAGSCNYSDNTLWVGEYYESRAYPLKGDHLIECNDGTIHHAWMVGYRITGSGGLKPYCVFSVPDKIQGITVLADGSILLSQSYGRTNPSSLLLCQDPRRDTPDKSIELEGYTVPLWCLDSVNGMESICAPPMAEGCCAAGDKVFLIYESAAYYYRAFAPDNTAVDPTDKIWMLTMPRKD